MQVYVAPEVLAIKSLHPYLVDPSFRALSIRDQIQKQADTVREAHAEGDVRVLMHLKSWLPDAALKSDDETMRTPLNIEDARLAISREYGFADWEAVDQLGERYVNQYFESALDDLLSGEIDKLRFKLVENGELVRMRSSYGHGATLLHYLGSNGVESHRQVVPLNGEALAIFLIEQGADPSAEANMYGGGQTPHALASTSAHPYEAGIAEALNAVLMPVGR